MRAARLRGLADPLAALGLDRAALLRLGRRAARADAALHAVATAAAAALPALRSVETFSVDAQVLANLPEEILLRLLEREIARIVTSPLRLERLERLTACLGAAIAARHAFAATLGGAALRVDGRGQLTIGLAPLRRPVAP